ncbi:MAG: T9SS type A sorting domain-containing protein, partial [Melioribacteraceae bacterium]|nr:T9SS type A sorting domain-containing protein [Melioribacteraceae bacterium]
MFSQILIFKLNPQKIFILLFFLTTIIFSQVDTTFNGLRGYEDIEGNTQLFYRLKSHYSVELSNDNIEGVRRKDIFHFDINNNFDSLFIYDYVDYHTPLPAIGHTVSDFEFVDNTLTNFYQCGDGVTSFEPSPVVVYNREYDNSHEVNSFHGETSNLEIVSVGNKSKVYVSTSDGVYTESIWGRYELESSTVGLTLLSINKAEPNILFVNNEEDYLLKSIDTGKTFFVVDSITSQNLYQDIYRNLLNRRFLYDSDGIHIYRIVQHSNNFQLLVSDNKGELNSWSIKYESESEMFISIDSTKSGLVYITNGNEIYESNDFGKTFQLFRQLDKNINGIYKKPNSEFIYVTTSHSLLEINSSSIKTLKNTIDYNSLSYFPLHVGDTWQYAVEEKLLGEVDVTNRYVTVAIAGKETIDGKQYYLLSDGEMDCYRSLRIDSTDATVWEYKNGIDCLIDSLSMKDVEDNFSNDCYGSVRFMGDTNKTIFDNYKQVKKFHYSEPTLCQYCMQKDYEYATGIGKISSHIIHPAPDGFESGYRKDSLVYAKIDGVEYGDLSYSDDNNICLRDSTLYLYQTEFNHDFADTTWLVNKSSEMLMVDSIMTNHGYSYRLNVFYTDSSSYDFIVYNDVIEPVTFSISANDSVQIILSNPDLCPICDGGEINVFTDSLHIFTNSKDNPVLLIAIIGDGTLGSENSETGNLYFSLEQNYPNPFNPSTAIKYSIPSNVKGEMANVKLVVFDILGREVATLVNKEQKAGNYDVKFDASKLTSGIYLYR